jgi:hypothetical protein
MRVRGFDTTFDSSTFASALVSAIKRRPWAHHDRIALEKAGTVGHDFVLIK